MVPQNEVRIRLFVPLSITTHRSTHDSAMDLPLRLVIEVGVWWVNGCYLHSKCMSLESDSEFYVVFGFATHTEY